MLVTVHLAIDPIAAREMTLMIWMASSAPAPKLKQVEMAHGRILGRGKTEIHSRVDKTHRLSLELPEQGSLALCEGFIARSCPKFVFYESLASVGVLLGVALLFAFIFSIATQKNLVQSRFYMCLCVRQ